MDFLKPISSNKIPCPDPTVKAESGFLDLYTGKNEDCRFCQFSAREQILSEVKKLLDIYSNEEAVSITITGHSLGAALAILSAYDIIEIGLNALKDGRAVPICVFSFSGPRVGNARFKERLEMLGLKVLRVVNVHDLVPKSPGLFLNEQSPPMVMKLAQGFPWSYSHVGVELALDHKKSPFLKPTGDPVCEQTSLVSFVCLQFFQSSSKFQSLLCLVPWDCQHRFISFCLVGTGMGKKLDALLGRAFKTSKFISLVNLAISRLAVFRKKRQVQCSQARSDVLQLLELGHHESALLRVEHVIKEQNMLDVFVMIESYCNLLIERINLIEQERVCPDELKEAVSSLLYAASRCGEFPELQEIRAVLTTRFGKEFASRAIDLRNNCGVNHKMILKLSTRQPSLENRMKVLKEIASENNIVLQLEEAASISTGENLDVNKNQNQLDPKSPANSGSTKLGDNSQIPSEEVEKNDGFSDSMKTRKKYRDVADAAQAAFESAAYAAAAARAAVELSRSEPHNPDDHDGPSTGRGNEYQAEEMKRKDAAELKRSMSTVSSDSGDDIVMMTRVSSGETVLADPFEKELQFDESDIESEHEQSSIQSHSQIPSGFQTGLKLKSVIGLPAGHAAEGSGRENARGLNIEKRPISMRTRQVRGY